MPARRSSAWRRRRRSRLSWIGEDRDVLVERAAVVVEHDEEPRQLDQLLVYLREPARAVDGLASRRPGRVVLRTCSRVPGTASLCQAETIGAGRLQISMCTCLPFGPARPSPGCAYAGVPEFGRVSRSSILICSSTKARSDSGSETFMVGMPEIHDVLANLRKVCAGVMAPLRRGRSSALSPSLIVMLRLCLQRISRAIE